MHYSCIYFHILIFFYYFYLLNTRYMHLFIFDLLLLFAVHINHNFCDFFPIRWCSIRDEVVSESSEGFKQPVTASHYGPLGCCAQGSSQRQQRLQPGAPGTQKICHEHPQHTGQRRGWLLLHRNTLDPLDRQRGLEQSAGGLLTESLP